MANIIEVVARGKDLVSKELKGIEKSINTFDKRLKTLGETARKVGKDLSLKLTAPIVAFGALAVKTATEFQASMNFVRAVTKTTGKDFEKLETLARDLGRTTQFSASQAAEAMKFLGLSGLKTNEIMQALPKTLELAASAQLDLSSAANIVTGVVKGMGLSFSELGRVNDVLVNTFTSSKTNLEDLGEAMSKVGAVASTFGFGLEEVSATLGLLAEREFAGALGGTALRRIITNLASLTPKAAKAFKKYKIEVQNADGSIKSLADVLEEFEGAAKRGASQTDIARIALEAFGQRGGPAFLAALAAGSDRLREFTKSLEEEGSAARIAQAQMEGLPGIMKRLVSVWESLQLAIVKSGLGAWVEKVVSKLSDFIEKLASTNPKLLAFITVLAGLAATIGPLLITLGLMASAIGAITALASPVVLAIGGISLAVIALGALAVWLINEWEPIKKFFINLWKDIGDVFDIFVEIGRNIINGIVEGIKGAANKVYSAITDVPLEGLKRTKSALKISSPSKLYAEQVGKPIAEGIILGLVSMHGKVQKVIEDLTVPIAMHKKTKKILPVLVNMHKRFYGNLTTLVSMHSNVFSKSIIKQEKETKEFIEDAVQAWENFVEDNISQIKKFTRKRKELTEQSKILQQSIFKKETAFLIEHLANQFDQRKLALVKEFNEIVAIRGKTKQLEKAFAKALQKINDAEVKHRKENIEGLAKFNLAQLQRMLEDTQVTVKQREKIWTEINEKIAESNISLFNAFRLGVRDATDRFENNTQIMLRTGRELANGLREGLSNIFFDFFDTKITDMTESFEKFGDSLRDTFFRALSDMAAKLAASGLLKILLQLAGRGAPAEEGEGGIIQGLLSTIAGGAGAVGGEAGAGAGGGVGALGIVGAIVAGVVTVASGVISKIIDSIVSFVEKIPQLAFKFAGAIEKIVTGLVKGIIKIIKTLPKIIAADSKSALGLVKTMSKILPTLVMDLITSIIDILPEIADALVDTVVSLLEALPDIVENLINGLVNLVVGIIERLPTIVSTILRKVPEIVIRLISALPGIVIGLIKSLVEGVLTIVTKIPGALIGAVKEGIEKLIKAVINVIKGAGGIIGGAGRVGGGILGAIGGVVGGIGRVFCFGKIVGDFFLEEFSQTVRGGFAGALLGSMKGLKRPATRFNPLAMGMASDLTAGATAGGFPIGGMAPVGGGTVIVQKLDLFPNITASDALLNIPRSTLEDWAQRELIPVLDELNRRGIAPESNA